MSSPIPPVCPTVLKSVSAGPLAPHVSAGPLAPGGLQVAAVPRHLADQLEDTAARVLQPAQLGLHAAGVAQVQEGVQDEVGGRRWSRL